MTIRLKKSQSSMEFFTLIGLAFLAAAMIIAVSAKEMREFKDNSDFALIKDLGFKLQKEIGIAAYVEDGYKRTFTIPDKLEGALNYSIVTGNSSIAITTSKTSFSVRIPITYGNFTKGTNIIERISDKIYVNK